MAAMKTMRQKMADEGLQSFIVTYSFDTGDSTVVNTMQFWAEDAGHAGEQFDDLEEPDAEIVVIETQDEYETRTGETLDYGRKANR